MYLITPNPNKENIDEDHIYVVKDKGELDYYINECAKNSKSHTACLWKLSEEHIGKFKEFTISAFVHTDNGEVLPK